MSLQTTMRAMLKEHPDTPAEVLAKSLLSSVDPGDLVALLAEEFEHVRRGIVRQVEVEELRSRFASTGDVPDGGGATWSARIRQQVVALGNGSPVLFGSMTVEQHRTRVAMLSVQRAGLDRTISLHEQAIITIEAAGVSCLDALAETAAV